MVNSGNMVSNGTVWQSIAALSYLNCELNPFCNLNRDLNVQPYYIFNLSSSFLLIPFSFIRNLGCLVIIFATFIWLVSGAVCWPWWLLTPLMYYKLYYILYKMALAMVWWCFIYALQLLVYFRLFACYVCPFVGFLLPVEEYMQLTAPEGAF